MSERPRCGDCRALLFSKASLALKLCYACQPLLITQALDDLEGEPELLVRCESRPVVLTEATYCPLTGDRP